MFVGTAQLAYFNDATDQMPAIFCMAHLRCKTLYKIFEKYRRIPMTTDILSEIRISETAHPARISAEAHSHYRQASEFLHQGKTEDALHCLIQAVEIAPDFAEALHETGNCLQNLGRCEEASLYYSRALKEIGDRLCEIGRYEESVGKYWVAIRRYEEAGEFYDRRSSPARLGNNGKPKEKPAL